MKYAVLIASLAIVGCTTAPWGSDRYARLLTPTANPSRVIATELAFARTAREKGTWTAFRHYATADALWPGPNLERVQDALKDAPDPAEPIVWGPDRVWSSCDGSFAVSTGGARYPNGGRGRFLSVWQLQDDGEYRWVLDQGFDDQDAEVAPDTISAVVADCTGIKPQRSDVRRNEAWGSGKSNDGTLEWSTHLAADCARTVIIKLRQADGSMAEVFRREAPAPKAPEGRDPPTCAA